MPKRNRTLMLASVILWVAIAICCAYLSAYCDRLSEVVATLALGVMTSSVAIVTTIGAMIRSWMLPMSAAWHIGRMSDPVDDSPRRLHTVGGALGVELERVDHGADDDPAHP